MKPYFQFIIHDVKDEKNDRAETETGTKLMEGQEIS